MPSSKLSAPAPAAAADSSACTEALVLRLREEVLPVIDLCTLLRLAPQRQSIEADQLVVVMRVGSLTFGVIVDTVSDVQEIVVKPLGASLDAAADVFRKYDPRGRFGSAHPRSVGTCCKSRSRSIEQFQRRFGPAGIHSAARSDALHSVSCRQRQFESASSLARLLELRP